jgi:dinuclear metal center YbgI/SA1388 family protein
MKLNEIIKFLDDEIPRDLALSNDNIGFMGDYDLNQDIKSIKIFMDLYPKDDNFDENTLIITHHPTLFTPKTPTFTIHSNWDIIKGGANEALADELNLKVVEPFDKKTNIGRICESDYKFNEIKKIILDNFPDANIVNKPKNDELIKKVGIISGFGLKNQDYIKMAKENNLDILISGDLTQETAILAINLDLTLIDLGHHNSEVPGLYYLKKILEKLDINCEVIDKNPINKLK